MHLFEMKTKKRIEKVNKLENGSKQFCMIPGHDNRAYVWVGNVTFPVPNVAAR